MDNPEASGNAIVRTEGRAPLARAVPTDSTALADALDGGEAEATHRASRRPFSLAALLRFKWTVIGVTLAVAPLAVAAVWLAFEPQYRARALIHIRSKLHHLIEETDDTGRIPLLQYDRYLQSQVEIIRSAAVVERVKDRDDVRATAWHQEPPSAVSRALDRSVDSSERLAEEIDVNPVRKTELIEIGMATRHPADAAVIVNAFVEEYEKYVGDLFTEEDEKLISEVEEIEGALNRDVGTAQKAAAEARRKLRTGSSADDLILQQRVRRDQKESELADLEFEINVAQRQLHDLEEAAQTATSKPVEGQADATALYQRDPERLRLHNELKLVEHRLAEASVQFQPLHPTRVKLQQEVNFARQMLVDWEHVLDALAAAGLSPTATQTDSGDTVLTVPGLRAHLDQLGKRREELEESIKRLTAKYASDFEASETLRTETRKIEALTQRLELVQQRMRGLFEKGRVPPSIKVISLATPPTRADNADKRMKLGIAALFGAFAMGLAAAYLRFLVDPKVGEPADVHRAVPGPFLGYLPLARQGATEPLAPNSLQTEAIRVVRAAVLNRLWGTTGHVIQVTSADPGAGKSTLAILLARSLAHVGKRVLLIDADVRRSSLHRHFGVAGQPGLVDLLKTGNAPGDAVLSTELPSLSVLLAGGSEGSADLELLANGDFSALLEDWRTEFDFTILDSPPLLGTADAAILSRQADGTLLVVRERHSRRAALTEGLALMSTAGGRLLGTVFVGSRRGDAYAGYYYYAATTLGDSGPGRQEDQDRG